MSDFSNLFRDENGPENKETNNSQPADSLKPTEESFDGFEKGERFFESIKYYVRDKIQAWSSAGMLSSSEPGSIFLNTFDYYLQRAKESWFEKQKQSQAEGDWIDFETSSKPEILIFIVDFFETYGEKDNYFPPSHRSAFVSFIKEVIQKHGENLFTS